MRNTAVLSGLRTSHGLSMSDLGGHIDPFQVPHRLSIATPSTLFFIQPGKANSTGIMDYTTEDAPSGIKDAATHQP